MHTFPKISIIIPVYNGAGTLSSCLDSVMALDYPKECLEVIVIDNNSTDSTKEIIRQYPVKYVFEAKKSFSLARNKGINNSSGEFIAFIDADCIADKDWLAEFIKPLDDERIGGAGGKIISFDPRNWIEKYIDFNNFYSQCGQVSNRKYFLPWIVTANSIFRRSVLQKVGLFDVAFSSVGGEDVDLISRIVLSGYRIQYVSSSLIFHKHRSNLKSFFAWRFRWGSAAPYLFLKYQNITKIHYKKHLLGEALRLITSAGINVSNLIKSIFKVRNRQNRFFSILGLIGDTAYFFGYFHSWAGLLLRITKILPLEISNKNGVLWWDEGNALTILDLSKDPPKYHYVNVAGKRIWELLAIHNKSVAEIMNIFDEEYDVNYEILKNDIENFIENLKKVNILREKYLVESAI